MQVYMQRNDTHVSRLPPLFSSFRSRAHPGSSATSLATPGVIKSEFTASDTVLTSKTVVEVSEWEGRRRH